MSIKITKKEMKKLNKGKSIAVKKQKNVSSAEFSELNEPKTKRFKFTKKQVQDTVRKYIILTIASLLLSISVVVFMDPLVIVSGGLTGIAIIINTLIAGDWLDIILYIGEAILIILSFIFLGKKTTLKSLYACLMVPFFTTLFTRVIPLNNLIEIIYGGWNAELEMYNFAKDTALLILGGLFGGILTGLSVGLAFSVGGSTGGVDTIVLIIKKYFPRIKESIICFIIDATIIVAGIITAFSISNHLESYNFVISIINITTAVITAVTIEAYSMSRNTSVIITIISDKWEEVNEYINNVIDRGTTLYPVYGGYTKKERMEIKTTVSKKQAEKTKEEILKIDPNCFLTLTNSKGVFGEGFQSRFSDN